MIAKLRATILSIGLRSAFLVTRPLTTMSAPSSRYGRYTERRWVIVMLDRWQAPRIRQYLAHGSYPRTQRRPPLFQCMSSPRATSTKEMAAIARDQNLILIAGRSDTRSGNAESHATVSASPAANAAPISSPSIKAPRHHRKFFHINHRKIGTCC